ncbi:HlyD family type I secretion periplasmic adaptor subunit [Roseateles amylovorans]|uniref:Membrane fusion protein (MFP) family protein n=1 Tax=Roseateles amylovorans TaxID=2978473 RepID=A0ABY6AUG2_9BURK|nr:HlyD family type I secretion periplasmic adaptor subunit [Roseateles amylovorans]UXH76861.1 HlyD family type I secretion periplasmic adaptor subunit [Roseateles amylovorans]
MAQERTLTREEGLFVGSVNAALIDEPLPRAVWVLYLLAAVLLVGVAWSSIATVDEVTRSDGRIVPDGKEQIITSLESGMLSKLLVREGEEVEAGQPLAELDPTRAEAAQNESQVKRLGVMAQVARLRAEALGQALKFPPEVQQVQRLVDSETEVFETRRRVLEEAVSSINRSVGLLATEQKMAQDMASKGLMSNVEVMRLTRQVNELQQQRNERISRFRQEASTDLSRVQTELAQIDEQMVVRRDALQHTVLKSPVKGLVKNIKMNTVGGVVSSGAPIMEIVPLGPRVLVEARVKPRDIGFVQVGQSAIVKLSGYDYNVNGGLHGKIEYISPDALGETEKNGEGTYYRAIVAADRSTLQMKGEPLPVIPGMTASVEIRTGERSVLSYLLRPMLKSREALRER